MVYGEVCLVAKDGRKQLISSDDERSKLPIARLRPRMYKAEAITDIMFFSISKSVLDELQRGMNESRSELLVDVIKAKAGEDGHILLHEFQQELDSGQFNLPSLPETAFRIRDKPMTQTVV